MNPAVFLIPNSSDVGVQMACRSHEGDIFVPWLTHSASVACWSDSVEHSASEGRMLDLRNQWGVVRCPYPQSLRAKFASAPSN